MSALRDYYKVLQVDPEADTEVITAAFRALARRLHPDRDSSGVAEYRMAELNQAYAILRDPAQRSRYDADRALELQAVGPGHPLEAGTQPGARGGLAARWRAAEEAAASGRAGGDVDAESEETRLSFGRYAGMTLREIAAQDAEYLRWLARHSSGLRYRSEIERLLRQLGEDAYSPRSSR